MALKDFKIKDVLANFLKNNDEAKNLYLKLVGLGMTSVFEKYLSEGDEGSLKVFFEELKNVDFERLKEHREVLLAYLRKKDTHYQSLEEIEPVIPELPDGYEGDGRDSLERGEWAVAVLAGGAGTRFFSELQGADLKSKGLFPITPVEGISFLDFFCAEITGSAVRCGRAPYWLIMTSSITYEEIKKWVESSPLSGFPKEYIILLRQREHPRLDHEGIILARKSGELVWTGDGHGGLYFALQKNRIEGVPVLKFLMERKVKNLVLHNVDNILARPLSPARLGYHISKGKLFTLSAIKRRRKDEKLGIFVYLKNRGIYDVIEYSVCPQEIMNAVKDEGLKFDSAHINTNFISLKAVPSHLQPTLYTGKIVDVEGKKIETSSYEVLNQHLTRILKKEDVGIVEVKREDYYLPTKSIKGADSVDETRKGLSEFFKRTLRNAGAEVDDTAEVEINPALGMELSDILNLKIGRGWKIGRNAKIYLGVALWKNPFPYGVSLTLEDGAELRLRTDYPYGKIKVNSYTRSSVPDRDSAGLFKIGSHVIIKKGVKVDITVEGGGRGALRDRRVFKENLTVKIGKGENLRI